MRLKKIWLPTLSQFVLLMHRNWEGGYHIQLEEEDVMRFDDSIKTAFSIKHIAVEA